MCYKFTRAYFFNRFFAVPFKTLVEKAVLDVKMGVAVSAKMALN